MSRSYIRHLLKDRIYFLPIVVWLFLSITINAQSDEPYSKISMEINFLHSQPSEFFNKYWKSKYGIQGFISTPFYAGKLQAGINYYTFAGRNEKRPNFKSFFIHAGWGKDMELPLKIVLSTSIKAGSFLMYFNVDSTSAFQRFESELAAGANISLKIPVIKNVRLNAGGEFLTVFLNNKIKLLTASLGLEYTFASPVWIRDFFK